MRYVVLKRVPTRGAGEGQARPGELWERLGAVEAEERDEAVRLLSAASGGGVCVAIEWSEWIMFEAEATVTVTPLTRHAPPTEVADDELDDLDEPTGITQAEIDEDLEGMVQGPKLR